MLNRFGPWKLFDFTERKLDPIVSRLQELNEKSRKSRTRDWKEFSLNYEDIKEKTIWAAMIKTH